MAEGNGDGSERRGFQMPRVENMVTTGNLITLIPLVIAGTIWGARLESRQSHESEIRARVEQEIRRDIGRLENETTREALRSASSVQRIEAEIARLGGEIRGAMEKLGDKIDRKADRQP